MLISVIIPTYNRFDQLQKSIRSVKEQTVDTQIIVVNDCSTDVRYKDLDKMYPDVTFIHLPVNLREKYGVKGAAQGLVRNEAFPLADGEWIAFLDDDDRYVNPMKLEKQLNVMQKYGCLMSSTNMFIGKDQTYFTNPFQGGKMLEIDIYLLKRADIIPTNYINNSSVIVHKSIIDKTGGFRLVGSEDYEHSLRVLEYTDCVYLHQPMVYYELGGVKYYQQVTPLQSLV